jgi:hypothetical protein
MSPRKDIKQLEPTSELSRKYNRPGSSSSDVYSGISKISRIKDDTQGENNVKRNQGRNYHMGNLKNQQSVAFKVTPDQQNLSAEWLEDIRMKEVGVIEVQ